MVLIVEIWKRMVWLWTTAKGTIEGGAVGRGGDDGCDGCVPGDERDGSGGDSETDELQNFSDCEPPSASQTASQTSSRRQLRPLV